MYVPVSTPAFVYTQLFGGLLVALQSLPGWIEWMKFLSFIRYSIEVGK